MFEMFSCQENTFLKEADTVRYQDFFLVWFLMLVFHCDIQDGKFLNIYEQISAEKVKNVC